jgi:hypothetical protein
MNTRPTALAILGTALLVGACSTPAANTATNPPPVATATATQLALATAAPTDAATAAPGPTLAGNAGPPPDVDPCTLLTDNEADALKGKLGTGVSGTAGPDRTCTWKSGLSEVKLLLAPEAPSAAVAQSYWDAAKTQIPSGIPIADVPGFDRAAYGSGSSQGIAVSALFVIHGTWFFDLFCGFPECSVKNSVDAANLVVGRLP